MKEMGRFPFNLKFRNFQNRRISCEVSFIVFRENPQIVKFPKGGQVKTRFLVERRNPINRRGAIPLDFPPRMFGIFKNMTNFVF